jgi:hypothetical protein
MRHATPIAAALAATLAACATPTLYPGADIYLALYRPLDVPPGTTVVYPTAALTGTLAIRNGCIVVETAPGGPAAMPAFRDQVRLVTRNGALGLQDTTNNNTAWVGDPISLGGASAPDDAGFIASRFITPPPPSCREHIFVSNFGL